MEINFKEIDPIRKSLKKLGFFGLVMTRPKTKKVIRLPSDMSSSKFFKTHKKT